MMSNRALAEQVARLRKRFNKPTPPPPTCPNKDCENHKRKIPVSEGKKYYVRDGKTGKEQSSWLRNKYGKRGTRSQRYICKACKEKFTVRTADPMWHKKQPEKCERVFSSIKNHQGVRDTMDDKHVSPSMYYKILDFIYEQCVAFTAAHERKLSDPKYGRRKLYLSVDAQDHTLNWKVKGAAHDAPKNVRLSALCTADNLSGYVLAAHMDYDPDADWKAIEWDTAHGDDSKNFFTHERKYAAYRIVRDDLRARRTVGGKHPEHGKLLHEEYWYYTHFLYVKDLFGDRFSKARFSLDADEGLDRALLSVFKDDIISGKVDGFIAVNEKPLVDMVDPSDKRRYKNRVKAEPRYKLRRFFKRSTKNKRPTRSKLSLLSVIRQMKKAKHLHRRDQWITHPDPHPSEKRLMARMITCRGQYSAKHLAWLFMLPSVRGISGFFTSLRSKSAGSGGRTTKRSVPSSKIYAERAVYNPAYSVKYLEIQRTIYNYVSEARLDRIKRPEGAKRRRPIPKDQKPTRAMKFGLADRAYTLQDILDFRREGG